MRRLFSFRSIARAGVGRGLGPVFAPLLGALVVALALGAAPAHAADAVRAGGLSPVAVRLPDLAQLLRAAKSGDDVELERVGGRLGAVRLARVAVRGKRDERLAALRALPLLDDGWAVLPDVAQIAVDPDAEVGRAASEAARRLAERIGGSAGGPVDEEMPRDVPARAARDLAELVGRASLPGERRAVLIAALAALRPITKVDEPLLVRLVGLDADAAVRKAAAEALYNVSAAEAALGQAVEKDANVEVAAAAAAALCRDVAPTAPVDPKKLPQAARAARTAELEKRAEELVPARQASVLAEARAGRLSPGARQRLRTLASDEATPLADRLDLLACLRVGAQPPDKAVLDALARAPKSPEAVKRRARSLGGR